MNDFDNYPDELGNFIRHFRKARGLTLRGWKRRAASVIHSSARLNGERVSRLRITWIRSLKHSEGISRTGCIIWPTTCLILSTSRR